MGDLCGDVINPSASAVKLDSVSAFYLYLLMMIFLDLKHWSLTYRSTYFSASHSDKKKESTQDDQICCHLSSTVVQLSGYDRCICICYFLMLYELQQFTSMKECPVGMIALRNKNPLTVTSLQFCQVIKPVECITCIQWSNSTSKIPQTPVCWTFLPTEQCPQPPSTSWYNRKYHCQPTI